MGIFGLRSVAIGTGGLRWHCRVQPVGHSPAVPRCFKKDRMPATELVNTNSKLRTSHGISPVQQHQSVSCNRTCNMTFVGEYSGSSGSFACALHPSGGLFSVFPRSRFIFRGCNIYCLPQRAGSPTCRGRARNPCSRGNPACRGLHRRLEPGVRGRRQMLVHVCAGASVSVA